MCLFILLYPVIGLLDLGLFYVTIGSSEGLVSYPLVYFLCCFNAITYSTAKKN